MRNLFASTVLIVSLILTFFGKAVYADDKGSLVVVELYTSEGCSSCPPADALLTQLASRDDVLALALHVDYWDYLGWKDEFAMAKFTKRQEIYNSIIPSRYRLVTPQMVFHGREQVAGAKPRLINEYIEMQRKYSDLVDLKVQEEHGMFWVHINPVEASIGKADVFIVQYTPELISKIKAGENRGKTLKHTNIVTSWEKIGEWNGQEDWSVQQSIADGMSAAVIVQATGNGPILAARKLQ